MLPQCAVVRRSACIGRTTFRRQRRFTCRPWISVMPKLPVLNSPAKAPFAPFKSDLYNSRELDCNCLRIFAISISLNLFRKKSEVVKFRFQRFFDINFELSPLLWLLYNQENRESPVSPVKPKMRNTVLSAKKIIRAVCH